MFKQHRPPHYYFYNKIYFITARTIEKKKVFNTEEKKNLLKKTIKEAGDKFKISFYAWIILDNHYHLLLNVSQGELLPAFMKVINGKSSFLLNKIDKTEKRKIWFNYWDKCVRNEKDFWVRFNYIHHNSIKHRYAKKMKDYQFSSYDNWIKKESVEWINDVFEKYPIVDFTVDGDE
ncbi:MAG: hypothetical protein GWP10_09850 [Nitrospiraceae bacterium]|nr:hypothetical protein [Nitrospiraceae bacterium]